jgi:hypothetical protein
MPPLPHEHERGAEEPGLLVGLESELGSADALGEPRADRAAGLIAASAPRTAQLLDDMGFTPVVVDISEFEKLEGCVTCLSVLLPGQ